MSEEGTITHSFSRNVANIYGVNAAILLAYISYRIERSTNIKDGKRWYFDSFDALAEHYPYLSKTTIYNAVQHLTSTDGPLITGNFNKWKQDKTTWYAFRNERTIQQMQAEPLYFKVPDAVAYGVVEAVLITNLTYWIGENRKKEPSYQFHPMSPKNLAKHLPFSRNTIQRGLDNLVDKKVLASRNPDDGRKPREYALVQSPEPVSGCPNMNDACPDQNMDAEVPKTAQIPVLNLTCPVPNIAGPIQNLTCPDVNIGGPKVNDITILIDNPLKASRLKEDFLKENHFKAPVCVFSSKSQTDESPIKPSPVQNEGFNALSQTIADPIQGQSNLQCQVSSVTSTEDSSSVNVQSPDTAPSSNPAPKPAHSPSMFSAQTLKLPEVQFLDPLVHQCCWDVLNQHSDNASPILVSMAENIIGAAEMLINQTEPSEIYRLRQIKSQAELNANLAVWSAGHFAGIYDKHFAFEGPENAGFRDLFIDHAHCFMNMGFHSLKFDERRVYCGRQVHEISYAAFCRMNEWLEKQAEARRQDAMKQRALNFASPDKDKESDAGLSAAEKMQVFNQSLQARNRIGRYDENGQFTEGVVLIQRQSLNYVRQFFQLNPSLTPAYLNLVLDECLKLPRTIDGLDPVWYAKNGYKISFLITNLATIAGQLNMLSKLPAFVPIPVKTEEEEEV